MFDNLNSIPQFPPMAIYILLVWALIWKGLALWRAAKCSQRNWFIAILVLNTVGLLEIVYLFYFSKNKLNLSSLREMLHI